MDVRKPLLTACIACLCACAGSQRGSASPTKEEAEWYAEREVYRAAVGGLGAGFLYQTHISIGETADLFGKQVYGADEVQALMDIAVGMGKNVAEALDDVRRAGVGTQDRATLDQMLEINRLLSEQAEALKRFTRDQSRETANAFARSRKSTWVRLEALLNIQHE